MEFEPDNINLEPLERFIKAVKSKNPPYAKIGILGTTAQRSNGKSTNAEIGAAHEYGSPEHGLPIRSFLRMPLSTRLPKTLENTPLVGDDKLKEVIKEGTFRPWMETIATLAEGVSKESFDSNGFGTWEELDADYAEWKDQWFGTDQILVATGQLRDSITHEVVVP